MLNYIEEEKEFTDEQIAREFEDRVEHLVNSFKTVQHDNTAKYIDEIKSTGH